MPQAAVPLIVMAATTLATTAISSAMAPKPPKAEAPPTVAPPPAAKAAPEVAMTQAESAEKDVRKAAAASAARRRAMASASSPTRTQTSPLGTVNTLGG